MANLSIPMDERNMTPDDVETVMKRRQWGLVLQVISGQFGFFSVLLLLWSGQDLTYSPHLLHPMFYYNVLAFAAAIVLGLYGSYLKRGSDEYHS